MLCTVNDHGPLLVEKQGLVDIPVKFVRVKIRATNVVDQKKISPRSYSARGEENSGATVRAL